MSGFLSGKEMICMRDKAKMALIVATVSILFVCLVAVFYGYSKKRGAPAGEGGADPVKEEVVLEQVYTNRAFDAAYMQALADSRAKQSELADARGRLVDAMTKMVEDVRAALPPEADVEAIKAELAKLPEWKAMEEANARLVESIDATLAAAQETVRERMWPPAETKSTRPVLVMVL